MEKLFQQANVLPEFIDAKLYWALLNFSETTPISVESLHPNLCSRKQ
jgi:hypothetical protein